MKQHNSRRPHATLLIFTQIAFLTMLPPKQLTAGATNSVDEFKVQVLGLDANGELDISHSIDYEIAKSSTSQAASLFLLEDQYSCHAELVDTNGIAAHRSPLGQQLGSLFGNLDENPKYIRYDRPFDIFQNATNEIKTRRLKFFNGEIVPPTFFRPADLFEITNSGVYHLRLYFQFIESTSNNSVHLVELPTVDVKVHKP